MAKLSDAQKLRQAFLASEVRQAYEMVAIRKTLPGYIPRPARSLSKPPVIDLVAGQGYRVVSVKDVRSGFRSDSLSSPKRHSVGTEAANILLGMIGSSNPYWLGYYGGHAAMEAAARLGYSLIGQPVGTGIRARTRLKGNATWNPQTGILSWTGYRQGRYASDPGIQAGLVKFPVQPSSWNSVWFPHYYDRVWIPVTYTSISEAMMENVDVLLSGSEPMNANGPISMQSLRGEVMPNRSRLEDASNSSYYSGPSEIWYPETASGSGGIRRPIVLDFGLKPPPDPGAGYNRPPPRTKERKASRVGPATGKLLSLINMTTEGLDVLDCVFGAAGGTFQGSPLKKLEWLFLEGNIVNFDPLLFAELAIQNQIEDFIIGKMGQKLGALAKEWGWSGGIGRGPWDDPNFFS